MNRYYQIAGLKPGSEIVEGAYALRVDISGALQRPFWYNDEDLLVKRQKGEYVWASGGGTCLLNHRYLLVVQRAQHAKVNPGKFSLFTGRADNIEELLHPPSLARELFEELILFNGGKLYKPVCDEFQEIIDQVYAKLELDLNLCITGAVPLLLDHLLCSPKAVMVKSQDARWEGLLDCHSNTNKEVNILFVFAGDTDIEKLKAMDGEYHLENGKVIRHNRSVYLYDLYSDMGWDITINSKAVGPVAIPEESMTEHLHYLVISVKQKLQTVSPKW